MINQSVAAAYPTSSLLRQRAVNERSLIADVATRHAARHAVVALQGAEPIGAERLRQLCQPAPELVANDP